MDKLREWFRLANCLRKTVVWSMWACLLISTALGAVLIAIAALSP